MKGCENAKDLAGFEPTTHQTPASINRNDLHDLKLEESAVFEMSTKTNNRIKHNILPARPR